MVLVPRRAGIEDRDELWSWLREDWWAPMGLPIYEGHHYGGLFNRSAAVNTAAALADSDGRWDVAVVIDADVAVAPTSVRSAVLLAHASGQITWAFHRWAGLHPEMSARIRAGYDGGWDDGIALEFLHTASSCVVIPRPLWDLVGGFDEQFAGWGFEDVAMSLACQSIGGGCHRIAGTVYHFHHAPAPGTGDSTHPIWRANQERCAPYVAAGHADRRAMEAVLRASGQWRRFDP